VAITFKALVAHQQRPLRFAIYDLPFTIDPLPITMPAMRRAIYPGSFDPVTNGHLDIIERGCKLFDEIIIAILVNPDKQPFFTMEERTEMLTEVLLEIERGDCEVLVDSFQGLLVSYAVAKKADAIVRGIRAISDYEYELQMALMNRRLEPSIETVFMMPAESYSYVSSRLVKEVFLLGGTLDGLVPAQVEARMKQKIANS
jgi:pantetheine-phosphate adenylyltransferase